MFHGFGLILTIILGGLSGWIASRLMNAETGIFGNIILGIFGALFGNWLFGVLFSTTAQGLPGQVIVAIGGACLLVWLWRALRGRNA